MRNKCISLIFLCSYSCHSRHSQHDDDDKMMNLIDENIDLIQDILWYSCMNQASTSQHFLTTRMQYKTLKFLRSIYTVLYKLFFKHKLYPVYKLPYMEGSLKCSHHSQLFTELCQNMIQHSYVLGEHFLQIDTDHDSWRQFNDQAIYLCHMSYGLTFHPTKCY